jgi:hypothetical protein
MDPLTRIQQLLAENKFDEAQALMSTVLSQPLSPAERGAQAVGLMSTYVQVMNAINSRYEQALKEAIEDLEAAREVNELLSQKVSGQVAGKTAVAA